MPPSEPPLDPSEVLCYCIDECVHECPDCHGTGAERGTVWLGEMWVICAAPHTCPCLADGCACDVLGDAATARAEAAIDDEYQVSA